MADHIPFSPTGYWAVFTTQHYEATESGRRISSVWTESRPVFAISDGNLHVVDPSGEITTVARYLADGKSENLGPGSEMWLSYSVEITIAPGEDGLQ